MKPLGSLPADRPFDVVGVGLNAVDTLVIVPEYPAFNSKVEIIDHKRTGGGQVATALVALQRWGLQTKYLGAVGDDPEGTFQRESLAREGIDLSDLKVVPGASTQMAVIIIESKSGERTILWRRDPKLARSPDSLDREMIERARVLLVDGHEIGLSIRAAEIASDAGMPVVLDIDSVRPGSEKLLSKIDFPVVSETFAPRLTGKSDLRSALREVMERSAGDFACATLGNKGALVLSGDQALRVHAPQVEAVDTTGAGDVFHGGLLLGLVAGWGLEGTLRYATAAAALNCSAYGARGGICERAQVEKLAEEVRIEPLKDS